MSLDFETYSRSNIASNVDRNLLSAMYGLLGGRKCVVCGFNDYAKHLINVAAESIISVIDTDEEMVGITFREFTVGEASSVNKGSAVLFTDHKKIYEFQRRMSVPKSKVEYQLLFPGRFSEYDIEAKHFSSPSALLGEPPPSMMPRANLAFLMEIAHYALNFPGDVVEIGVWQGGSAWHLMRMMEQLGDQRQVHLFDAFDDFPRHNPEAIMCLDEIRRRLSFYPYANFYRGYIERSLTGAESTVEEICFLHFDMGFRKEVLDWAWNRMGRGGVMLLDNYGHLLAWTAKFDSWFAAKGIRLIRVPFSQQAIAMVPPSACC